MKDIIYQIEFYSYWHVGSGLSGSTYADSIVQKNNDNLPFIPGKTIKGLLRDAATILNKLEDSIITIEFIKDVFGEHPKVNNEHIEGKAFFSNAGLSQYLSEKIIHQNISDTLYYVISSTKIDDKGQAQSQSLRQLEVTIPINLYGIINNFPIKDGYEQQLIYCFNWVRQLGLNRNRGLGRCQFSIKND